MRQLSQQEQATLLAGNYGTHLRVRVHRTDASTVDLASFLGADWMMGATISQSVDTPVAQATVSVRRNGPGGVISLSPLVDTSLANRGPTGLLEPLLQEGRIFRLDVQCTPGTAPTPDAWREVFIGRIDEVDAAAEELTFTGRDLSSAFQDSFIEEERNYGDATVGVAVQDVMTSIISDNVPNGFGPGFYCPVDPMWQLGRFTQQKQSVHEALNALAAQLGWEVRLRFREEHGWYLYLQSPERIGASAVWTVGPDEYGELGQVRRTLEHIRNAVEVVYWDRSDLDATGMPKKKTVTSTNPTSIATYGRRFMQVAEASASNINTEEEAQRLADVAIADLSDAALELEVEVPYCWHLEIHDVLRVLPDGVALSQVQELAIVGLDDFFAEGVARTKVKLCGRPATSRVEWMAREAVPSTAVSAALRSIQPQAKMMGPDAPTDLAPTATVNGFALAFKPAPTGPAWDSYELHVSTSPGFTPEAATLKAAASATRFEVADLQPGTTHYAVVRGRDSKGNVGPTSAQVELAPRYVEPRFITPAVNLASAPLNYDFECQASPSDPPDNWRIEEGTWGSDVVLTADAVSGSKALQFQGSDAIVVSQAFSVRPGLRYSLDVFAKGSTDATLAYALEWLDAAGAQVAVTYFYKMFINEPWQRYAYAAPAPAQARAVRARLESVLGAPGRTIQVDSVQLDLAEHVQESARSPFIFHGDWESDTSDGRGPATHYKDSSGRVHLEGRITGGTVGSDALTLYHGCYPPYMRDFAVATATGYGRVTVSPTGKVVLASGSPTWVSLNGISFRAA
ncbi:hypothetical protein [Corallococcus macrosporus]|uniref:Fibronectin type III domain-containing protein n=1 Tax=Myxococcus fulvus (strain ATCC BAA-855 / HW-1) TaxID=483219 RepID=F8C7Y5_MYXFH|nr:hypothetical protein [Corallococcus macrosporus]AEI66937.1 fibronectin type III domain-containing protein [Corallococcus macrosporus]